MGHRSFTIHVVSHDGYENRQAAGVVHNAAEGKKLTRELLENDDVAKVRVRDCLGGMRAEFTRDRAGFTPEG